MAGEPFPVHLADMVLPFRCVDAGIVPGAAAAAEFERAWPSYRRWFLHEGEESRPSYADSRAALARYMPELLDDYDALVESVGGGDLESRFLSQWCPPALVSACSLAMLPSPRPVMLRNYDYPPALSDTLALRTHWSGRAVLGMSDCGWGLMDGINDQGLTVSLAFGGRRVAGQGFGIGLVMRYLLQTCSTTDEAVARLAAVPVHMAYNIAILDAWGDARIAQVAPDRPLALTGGLCAGNRRGRRPGPITRRTATPLRAKTSWRRSSPTRSSPLSSLRMRSSCRRSTDRCRRACGAPSTPRPMPRSKARSPCSGPAITGCSASTAMSRGLIHARSPRSYPMRSRSRSP